MSPEREWRCVQIGSDATTQRHTLSFVMQKYDNVWQIRSEPKKSRSTVVVAGLIFGGEAFWRHDMKRNFSENIKTIKSLTLLKVAYGIRGNANTHTYVNYRRHSGNNGNYASCDRLNNRQFWPVGYTGVWRLNELTHSAALFVAAANTVSPITNPKL